MTLPPYGLCLPVKCRRIVDGDTVVVAFAGSDREWSVRLLDCWAPERNTVEGQAAKLFAQRVIDEAADELSLFIPAPPDAKHPLDLFTFGRILAQIFVGTEDTLSEIMVRSGHATKDKPPKRAA